MNATAVENIRTRQEWAEIINADWRKSIESIFSTAVHLMDAFDQLGERDFYLMVREDLAFSPNVARNLVKIARDPNTKNLTSRSSLPSSWRVISCLTGLSEADFNRGVESGIINNKTSLRAADAYRGSLNVPEGETWGANRKTETLPHPREAREIARETGRMVAASDGNVYSGATEEEGADHIRRRQQSFAVMDAINTLADVGLTPEQWLGRTEKHWLLKLDLAAIEAALEWLDDLRPAFAEHQGVIDGK